MQKLQFSLGVQGMVAALTLGCGPNTRSMPESPDALILYSIDGNDYPDGGRPQTAESFHGYPVLGKIEIDDAMKRAEVAAAVNEGIEHNEGMEAKCFLPRHALRATSNGQTTDFVICYECYQLDVYVGDKKQRHLVTSRQPVSLLNKQLTDAGVPLAKSPLPK